MSGSRRSFGWLGAELVVIVLSILIAFGLDAWWDERQLRQDLMEDLSTITAEVERNASELELELLFHLTALSSIDDLISRIDEADGAPRLSMPDTVASFALVFPPVFDPATGALNALVEDGGLSHLRDPRLKQLLAGIMPRVEDVRDGEMGARRIAIEELAPLFWESPDMEYAIGRSVEYRSRGLEPTPLRTRTIQLDNPPGLKNRLLLRRAWVTSAIGSIERLRTDLIEAMELIEVEIARSG